MAKAKKAKEGFTKAGKFAPGNNIGSTSKRPSVKNFMKKLEEALATVEQAEGKTLCQHAIERAFKDDKVLVAVLKKFAPDLAQVKIEPDGEIVVHWNIKDCAIPSNKE